MKKIAFLVVVLLMPVALHAETFTLYRSSLAIENARLHVATFDADDDTPASQYNRSNCELAAELFQSQPDVKTKFWCEKGLFRRKP